MVVPSVINVVFSSLVFPASVMLTVDSDAIYFDCVSSVVVDTDIVPDSIVVVSDPFADSDSAVVDSDLVIVASGAVRKITKMRFTSLGC